MMEMDSIKVTGGSFGAIAIDFWNLLPDIVSLIIGVMWIVYLYNKIRMEFK
tara:strand:- start:2166 stop:2318 length:153 start_codon:yes stop_codon:yes gene_type:complete